jgi:hypothetical protein
VNPSKADAVKNALCWLSANNVALPPDLLLQLETKGLLKNFKRNATKQADSIEGANTEYHDIITASLIDYFESSDAVTSYKNSFKQGTLNAFYDAFDLGWTDGGGELPIDDDDATSWLEARVSQELGFIDGLFQEAKELRKEKDFDYFSWITDRADGYVRTLAEVYNQAILRVSKDVMVTFDGDDGEESCPDCQKLKGLRHKISWFVKRNYVPPFGSGLQCARGGHCQHGLFDDDGNQITI